MYLVSRARFMICDGILTRLRNKSSSELDVGVVFNIYSVFYCYITPSLYHHDFIDLNGNVLFSGQHESSLS